MNAPRNVWSSLIGFCISNPWLVSVVIAMLCVGGLVVAPFSWVPNQLPRDSIAVDAIPDIGENQQIVFTQWPGRSPRDVEDQVTYPLTTALLGISGVRTVRSFSMLGFSTVYVLFEDDVEPYWSRSRILEKLSSLPSQTLPDGVSPSLGPDATALGQVFWYTLEGRDPDGKVASGWDLHELRSVQDWTVRYALQSVPGVAEVASVGGHVREVQVDVDPEAMRAHGVTLTQIARAVRESNLDVGARTVEINQVEYVVRGVGFLQNLDDLEESVIVQRDNTPIRIRDVARVGFGPANRRGALDKGGAEVVGGVVVARFGENPLDVLRGVHAKIKEISPSLPQKRLEDGSTSQVRIVPFYDRSTLIQETISTLSDALWQQLLITIIVVLILLRHLQSSLLISSVLPLAVLSSLLAMRLTGVDANVMSLAGIAIAIGTMVDMGIVCTENIVSRLREAPPDASRAETIRDATAEVAPAIFTSVATTILSFLPVFALTASEGKLFRPLAVTKTYALLCALLVAFILIPTLAYWVLWDDAPTPTPRSSRWKTWRASIVRLVHLRDWIVVALGVLVACTAHGPIGGFAILVGLGRILTPLLPKSWRTLPSWVEGVVAACAMVWVLSAEWMPLGHAAPMIDNVLFVGVLVFGLLVIFLAFMKVYKPLLEWTLDHKALFLLVPCLFVLWGALAWLGADRVLGWLPESTRATSGFAKLEKTFPGLGKEFMPSFDEGSFLYMPTTTPHASLGEALALLGELDASIQSIPEVKSAVGKIGRAETALDPAPVSMIETMIEYVPEYRIEADGTRVRQWRDHIRTSDDIWSEITRAATLPGLTSAPKLMPINTRIVMLQTGMRAPMGLKVYGPDLESIEKAGVALEKVLKKVPVLHSETVFAERVVGKPYLEIVLNRPAIARYGLTVAHVQEMLQIGVGGMELTQMIEGRARTPVRVRAMREERDSVDGLRSLSISTPSGVAVPLAELATLRYVRGPQVMKSEDTFLMAYVIFDRVEGVAEVSAVTQAASFLDEARRSGDLVLPQGVNYAFTGSYENQVRSEKRLMILVPVALSLIFVLLYIQFRSVVTSAIVYTGVLVAVSGGMILVWGTHQPWFLDVDVWGGVSARSLFQLKPTYLSVAVWVGFIALVGVATDDGVVMATYLKQSFDAGPVESVREIRARVVEAGLRRVRPCLMTTATTLLALLPVLTSQGRGADVMVPMALPSVGGMMIELMTLFVVPVLYCWTREVRWGWRRWVNRWGASQEVEKDTGEVS